MTNKPGEDPEDDELSALLDDALAGELVPTTEAAVRRAEAAGEEFTGELPPGLSTLREEGAALAPQSERRADVVSLQERRGRRGGVGSHLLAATLGAAAAASLLFFLRPDPAADLPATGASSEPAPRIADAALDSVSVSPVVLPEPEPCAGSCCAGSACAQAKADLRQCPSGRTCIACVPELSQARFRLRVSALSPLGNASALLGRAPSGSVDVCVKAGASRRVCAPVQAEGSEASPWTTLPLVLSAQELIANLELTIVARGAPKPLARWQSPVPVSATALCRGLSLRPKNDADEAFGVVSVFLDDAHFVEVKRSGSVSDLVELAGRISPRRRLKIFETRRAEDLRFALVLGPTDAASAERLRWTLLEGGLSPTLTVGDDHVGEPRPVE